ncbi:Bacteriophage lambda integrase, N-terminal domain [Pseudomonas arsenicoxydans]|uniref:Bacteriophage lambda integrase, N-terminal domain n=1 Tax=Pseudomonas arsenicoxydans TaxID=702115 RepID=A0A1H0KXM7_9PSED|nr:Bacteriophage lambda integrase, N-terminal domain [Pseudomonas arsenicoxydans]
MVPRPRNPANKGLPQNLYYDAQRSTYRYRRPTDGKWFPFGADRLKAIDAAKQLNLEFMRGADLVGAVMNNASETFAGFLDTYERDVLPPRELAMGVLGLYAVHFLRFRKHLSPQFALFVHVECKRQRNRRRCFHP